jgi:hypothetical protein
MPPVLDPVVADFPPVPLAPDPPLCADPPEPAEPPEPPLPPLWLPEAQPVSRLARTTLRSHVVCMSNQPSLSRSLSRPLVYPHPATLPPPGERGADLREAPRLRRHPGLRSRKSAPRSAPAGPTWRPGGASQMPPRKASRQQPQDPGIARSKVFVSYRRTGRVLGVGGEGAGNIARRLADNHRRCPGQRPRIRTRIPMNQPGALAGSRKTPCSSEPCKRTGCSFSPTSRQKEGSYRPS